MVLTFVFGLLI